jgi:competence protein ComEC
MTKKIGIFIIILFTLPISGVSIADIFIISKDYANIRSEPTTSSSILQKASKDDWFIYLGKSSDNKWGKIEMPDGEIGWIYSELGRIEDKNYLNNLLNNSDADIQPSVHGFAITRLEIHVINVRHGDSTLIIAHGNNGEKSAILIDAGKPGRGNQFVVPYLKSLGISELEYVISSHHDSDHAGGLDEVLLYDPENPEDFDIKLTGKAFVPDAEVSNLQKKEYDQYVNAVKALTGKNVFILSPPAYLPLANGITIQAVTGGGEYIDNKTRNVIDLEVEDANATSIGLLITFKYFKFFIAGDLGGDEKQKHIENLVASYIGGIDVLRVSNHGSETSTREPFLSFTKPKVALISTGSDNNFGYPRKSVIVRLIKSNRDIKIYQTDHGDQNSKYRDLVSFKGLVSGNIVISTDGGCRYSISGDSSEFSGKEYFINDDCL